MDVVRLIDKECLFCGGIFRAKKSALKRGRGKFCSKICKDNNESRKRSKGRRKCLHCEKETTNKKFCSRNCSASHNNASRSTKKTCMNCGLPRKSGKMFCSLICSGDYKARTRWEDALKTGEFDKLTSRFIKKMLILDRGNKCEICNCSEWMGHVIPLVLDHIDGNSENNSINNLRLVCGNCDMQLPTYKSKNIGNGRHYRRKRYAEGKSY